MDLQFLLSVQSFRESTGFVLDGLMYFISEIGYTYLIILALCLLYWCIDKTTGVYALCSFFVSSVVGLTMKCIVCIDRPWVRDTAIKPVEAAIPDARGFSFPSGHTINAVAIYGEAACFASRSKRRLLSTCLMCVCLLVGVSRIYCEVHTPFDVMGAFVIAIISICAVNVILPKILKLSFKMQAFVCMVVTLIVAVLAVFVTFKPYDINAQMLASGIIGDGVSDFAADNYRIYGGTIGALWGLLFEERFAHFDTYGMTVKKAVFRILCGFICVFIAFALLGNIIEIAFGDILGKVIKYALVAFVTAGIAPFIFKKVEDKIF